MFFDQGESAQPDIQFDPDELSPVTPYSDDLHNEYEAAQEQLRALKEQEEQLQRQAAELEELTRREEEFAEGRERLQDELQRHLSLLDREQETAEQLATRCAQAHHSLESQLAGIAALDPEKWNRADRKTELTRALGCVSAAEEAIEEQLPLLESFGDRKKRFAKKSWAPAIGGGEEKSFFYWLKSGLAFSLPLLAFAIIVLAVMLLL